MGPSTQTTNETWSSQEPTAIEILIWRHLVIKKNLGQIFYVFCNDLSGPKLLILRKLREIFYKSGQHSRAINF